ncbi:histidine phosphatase family protein [Pseudaminobacter sp. 19-2017]|uniref:Histidine phosphatase family protein n=1 Tax=Pseudaminobacter soli (ex Zhang et al. 2022) TaxID=2831468 RepID=A0A942I2E6_9HYPH|nr:histidine phosphatase family protein [Pseudaminobacter soli]MBS3648274.1 histidine phosphatase family protein [Pseudaminobacter soli]
MRPLIYFVRHGQTAWNIEGRFQGQAENDINELGKRQADRNGARLGELIEHPNDFDFVASPMRRTRETMERIRKAMGLPPEDYRTDDRLVEVNFGDWQGHTVPELEAARPGSTAARSGDKWHFVPPGEEAESYQMLLERVRPWFEGIVRPTVCVTHGGVMRTVFRMLTDIPPRRVASLEIFQDRVLRLEDGALEWL